MQKKCGKSTRFNRYLQFHKNRIIARYYVDTSVQLTGHT